MDKDGKTATVIIVEDAQVPHRFIVFADYDMLPVIKSVPGVLLAESESGKNKFVVYLDPRYDEDFVTNRIKMEIEDIKGKVE